MNTCQTCGEEIFGNGTYCSRECKNRWPQRQKEIEYGKPIRQILVESLNAHNTMDDAARQLKVSKNSLLKWMVQHEIMRVTYFE